LVFGYCWRPRPRGPLGRGARGASPGGGTRPPPAPIPGRCPNPGRPPGPPGRCPNPGRPPGAPAGEERVGCIGRRPAGPPGAPGAPERGGYPPGPPGRWNIGRPRWIAPGPDGALGRGGGALYTGRGPVCGIITRFTGAAAAAEASAASGACDAGAGGVGGAGATGGVAATGGGALGGAAGGRATTGFAGAAEAIAGRGVAAAAGGAAVTGGRATTGPAGGFAAIAGGCGGGALTIGGAWRGCGITTRRGGGSGLGAAAAGGAGTAGGAAAAGFCGAAAGFASAAAGGAAGFGRTTGRSASSLRCWIAFSTSPGFDTRDQSIFGVGASALAVPAPPFRLPPRWKCVRTRCASSASSELECVFGSVTPTSFSTSRMALLLTSSSLAKSLMRTLLIRPFTWLPACRPSDLHSNLMVERVHMLPHLIIA
jgi:hypothetical protein